MFNKKLLVKGQPGQEEMQVSLKAVRIKKTDCFTIKYGTDNSNKRWNRTFYINDTADRTIKTVRINRQRGTVTFNASALKDMVNKRQPLIIYTTSLPKDPAKAATVRVRRIILCRIKWD